MVTRTYNSSPTRLVYTRAASEGGLASQSLDQDLFYSFPFTPSNLTKYLGDPAVTSREKERVNVSKITAVVALNISGPNPNVPLFLSDGTQVFVKIEKDKKRTLLVPCSCSLLTNEKETLQPTSFIS